MARRKARPARPTNQLRIIGGEWRGRKLAFPDVEGLRPTHDRVRETLFNWLQAEVAGARCLDLFAGSGALGFEALSRGAEQVVLVDQSPQVVRSLKDNLRLLQCQRGEVVQADALTFLQSRDVSQFDMIFLDPPFNCNLLQPVIDLLKATSMSRGLLYLEYEQGAPRLVMPPGWEVLKSKQTAQLVYELVRLDAE